MTKVTLKIKGMSCNHCKMAVENEIKALNGIKNVTVSLEKNLAEVEYNEKIVDIEKIKHAVVDAGYEVE